MSGHAVLGAAPWLSRGNQGFLRAARPRTGWGRRPLRQGRGPALSARLQHVSSVSASSTCSAESSSSSSSRCCFTALRSSERTEAPSSGGSPSMPPKDARFTFGGANAVRSPPNVSGNCFGLAPVTPATASKPLRSDTGSPPAAMTTRLASDRPVSREMPRCSASACSMPRFWQTLTKPWMAS